eukprot:3893478-Lingulodinium_polyedra.AAC.1
MDTPPQELRAAATADRLHTPSPALARWMEGHGGAAGCLHPEEAARWMSLWLRQQRTTMRLDSRAGSWAQGPP